MSMGNPNDRPPNYREGGRLYLVRCFACGDSERGRENWAVAVVMGTCAFCGWTETPGEHE